jgi:hypothetical protein
MEPASSSSSSGDNSKKLAYHNSVIGRYHYITALNNSIKIWPLQNLN